MENILFVCTGNTCRSSMAEGIMKAIMGSSDYRGKFFAVSSAGICAYEGDSASPNAVKVLKDEWNIDISQHHSRSLDKRKIAEASLILTMTRGHKEAILSEYPEAKPKAYTLKEFVSLSKVDKSIEAYNFALDIVDPFGMNESVYKRCALEIHDAVEQLLEILNHK